MRIDLDYEVGRSGAVGRRGEVYVITRAINLRMCECSSEVARARNTNRKLKGRRRRKEKEKGERKSASSSQSKRSLFALLQGIFIVASLPLSLDAYARLQYTSPQRS